MDEWINSLVERVNDFLVRKPGALPLFGVGLIVVNFVLQLFPGPDAWIARSNLLLHVGLVLSLIGLLLVNVYRH
ncbi:MAG TPA: hypothetical protein VE553_04665 [Candidatus Binatia bacterium]|jgi:hypothetical protein|nr:hypothetical protein [Candidatus Binatia bacterium]